jgi:chromosome segregation protein
MQLRRLEIVGFKSFANKSTFLFDSNITVLAGPNGSGKSNVAEAVRWVLGEQRPSALRSRRADEVIFLGSDSRAPVGMAEVSLVMDNSEGRMGADFGEIRITRRIYRSGESEYLLNGRKVRLKDITDRILSVGLGPDTYTVIGQGAVDELIQQKPEERRVALENAADVRRHQIQLNETRSRLATTEENLTRCRDVLAELDPQVRRMRSHADRASRAREVQHELRGVSRRLYRHQYRAAIEHRALAERRQTETAEALRTVEDELAGREVQWRALEAESESLAQDLTEADRLVRDLRRQRDSLQSQLLQAREDELRLESEARSAQDQRERLGREQQELAARAASLHVRRAEAEAGREAARTELETIQVEERAASDSARAHRDALVAADAQMAELRGQTDREQRQRESAEQKVSDLRLTHLNAVRQIQRADEAVEAARSTAQAAADRLAEIHAQVEGVESELGETEREIGLLDAELLQARASQREAEQEQARLEAARASLDESLQRLVTDAAGATLRRAERGVRGVLGPSLRVREGYERLISAALADRVGHVVMDGAEDAQALTRRVLDADERAALVLAEFNDVAVDEAIGVLRDVAGGLRLSNDIFLGFATDVTTCDASIERVVRRYLGTTLMLDTVQHALMAAQRLAASEAAAVPWQIVTRDGHVLRWNGEWRTGSDQRQVRLVAGRAELAEIEHRITLARESAEPVRARLLDLEQRHERDVERRGALRRQAQDVRAALNETTREADARRRALTQAEQTRADAVSTHSATELQLRGLEETIASSGSRVQEIGQLLADLEGKREQAQAAVRVAEADLVRLREQVADRQRAAAEADAQLQAVAEEERREARLQSEIEERSRALSEGQTALQSRAAELGQTNRSQRARVVEIDAALPDADARLQDLLATMSQLASRRARLDSELNDIRARLRQSQTIHDAAALEVSRTLEDLTRLEREIAEELEDLGDELGVQMALGLSESAGTEDGPSGADYDPDEDPSELQREVRRLKRELARLGPVDDAALSEYQELIDRHEFLTQQSVDLERASESLRTAMADLEVLIQGGLDATLAEVNQAFQRTFERLFQGGEARLVWSDPDSPIASGIDIVAQPPGKRLQPLGNFSGGERALASVALVFALLQVNPTPFCVLDEVDAALDESNVGRFAEIIREWSSRTQFIVVTHNRSTMEIADSLFGISMDTHGVSRVVSLKLDQVLAAGEVT